MSWLRHGWQALRRSRPPAGKSAPPTERAVAEPPPPQAKPPSSTPLLPLPPTVAPAVAQAEAPVRPDGEAPSPGAGAPARFAAHAFDWEGRRHVYQLFVPERVTLEPAQPPLLVMLHGCRQNAIDFARGTDMNRLAARHGLLVLYPEQHPDANRMRCWNWFDKAHQGHAGEPAMIAALTRRVAGQQGADPKRIYIAGLSAGGAMAAVVAALYPELYSALGVHSGLPAGAATDVITAFAVMRRGGQQPRPFAGRRDGQMPTIVFHGHADDTVHPDNSEQLTALALSALQATGLALVREERPIGRGRQRRASRVCWLGPDGKSYLEHWSVQEGPHAWSGGHESGSFTDPEGPDASAAMLDFFLQHRRA